MYICREAPRTFLLETHAGPIPFWKLQEVVYFANAMKVLHWCTDFFFNHMEVIRFFSSFSVSYTWDTLHHAFLSLFKTQFLSAWHVPGTKLRSGKQGIVVDKIICFGVIHAYIASQLCDSLMELRASVLTPLVLIYLISKMVNVIVPLIT